MKTYTLIGLFTILFSVTVNCQNLVGRWKPCATIDKNGKYLKLMPKSWYDAEIAKLKKNKTNAQLISAAEISSIISNGIITGNSFEFKSDSTCIVKSAGNIHNGKYYVNKTEHKIMVDYDDSTKSQEWTYSFTSKQELKIKNFYYPETVFYFKKF